MSDRRRSNTGWIVTIIILIIVILALAGGFAAYALLTGSSTSSTCPEDTRTCVTGRAPEFFTAILVSPDKSDVSLEWSWRGSEPLDLAGFTLRRTSGNQTPVTVELDANARSYYYYNLPDATSPDEHVFAIKAKFIGGCESAYFSPESAKVDSNVCVACPTGVLPTFTTTAGSGFVDVDVATLGLTFANIVVVIKEGPTVSKTDYDRIHTTPYSGNCVGTNNLGLSFQGLKDATDYTVSVYKTHSCGTETVLATPQTVTTLACTATAITSTPTLTNPALQDIRAEWRNLSNNAPGYPLTFYLKKDSTVSAMNFDAKVVQNSAELDYTFENMRPGQYAGMFETLNSCGIIETSAVLNVTIM